MRTSSPSMRRAVSLAAAAAFVAALGLHTPRDAAAYTRAQGPRGGAVAAGPRGAVAVGPHGGAAAAGRRGAVAVGPGGGAAAVARPGYSAGRPAYPAYRPPVAAVRPVPVYPGYVQPAPVAGAVAVGVVAGATAGAVARATAPPPSTTTVIVASPPPAGGLAIGTELSALPAGCTTQRVGSVTYFQCGGAWMRAFMQGSNVTYLVVPAP
jgi:hypothetical protein